MQNAPKMIVNAAARGFTLTELLVILTLIAALSSWAIAGFDRLDSRLRSRLAAQELMRHVHLARQSAWTSGAEVVICRSTQNDCAQNGAWEDGWLTFINTDGDDPPRVDSNEVIVRHSKARPKLTITPNRSHFVFRSFGARSTNGTFMICDRKRKINAIQVIISYTGKPRIPAMSTLNCMNA